MTTGSRSSRDQTSNGLGRGPLALLYGASRARLVTRLAEGCDAGTEANGATNAGMVADAGASTCAMRGSP
jgi:hypothetical protein